MRKLFTREQARQFLKENNLKDADSIGNALVAQFKDLLQEALEAEMDHELGYSKYDWKNKEIDNSRNGHTKKTIKSRFGEMEINTPRDTNGESEPVVVKKHERILSTSVEDMIISKYPEEIRKIIYTTNPIEGFNRVIRKATKNKSSFPTDDSLFKLIIKNEFQQKLLRSR